MKLLIPVMGLFCLLFITSCKKDAQVIPPPIPMDEGDYITAIISLDTTAQRGKDTVSKWTFAYDSLKRLVEDRSFWRLHPSYLDLMMVRTYKYNGNDTLPYVMKVKGIRYGTNLHVDETKHFYYQNGIIVLDSLKTGPDYIVNEYSKLDANKWRMVCRRETHIVVNTERDTSFSIMNWSNGNLVTQLDSLYDPYGKFYFEYHGQLTYDSRPNPVKRVMQPYPTLRQFDATGLGYLFTPSANNLTSRMTDFGSSIRTNHYHYEYGRNGMPSVLRVTGDAPAKFIFQYTD